MYGNDTDNERVKILFQFVNEVGSFSYDNIKTFEKFSEYDWIPKENFKDLAYEVMKILNKSIGIYMAGILTDANQIKILGVKILKVLGVPPKIV